MQRYSIIQKSMNKCFVCGTEQNLHIHEIFFGTANRKLSIKYGCCVSLCSRHHNMSKDGVHQNRELDLRLKQLAQKRFEEEYPNESFLRIFGRNYIAKDI